MALVPALSACRHSGKRTEQHKTSSDYGNVSAVFTRSINHAGGDGVWVRNSRLRAPAHEDRQPSIEVMVTARVRAQVLEAICQQASTDKLQTRLSHGSNPSGNAETLIAIESNTRRLCVLRLVEVPRILQAAIIIDDLGQNLTAAHKLVELHYPLTFSIMPRVPYARETAELAHHSGREVMLHLPMQPLSSSHASVSPDELRAGMSRSEVERTVDQDLAAVPFVAGVNNHMGSLATASPELMDDLMTVLASRHLYFIDSRTTANTVALDVARRMGVPAFYRSVFLDDSPEVNYTMGQLRQLCAVVKKQGAAIAIGHPYPTTLAALARFLPEFAREEIKLVPASRLAHSPELARIHPPGHRHS